MKNRHFQVTLLLLFSGCAPALGLGPFVTDDVETLDPQNWEIYLGSQLNHDPAGWSGGSPEIEADYGAIPNVELHLMASLAFATASHGGTRIGYGDTELGVKYRFLQETDWLPQIGSSPLLEVPTGSESRELGSGHADVFLPLGLQKGFGKWETAVESGYWINRGGENRDWWFTGGVVQWQAASKLALGAEVYHETAMERESGSTTTGNFVGVLDLSERYHICFSAGHTIQGPGATQAYLAFEWTFGPEKEKEKEP